MSISTQERLSGGAAGRKASPPARAGSISRFLKDVKRDRYLILLIAPGILYFLIFKYVPMWGVIMAFQEYSPFHGVWGSPWVGLEHFRHFFSIPDFWIIFRNTMGINLMNLVLFFPLPIVLSLMLNEVRSHAYKRIVQSIVYMPHFLSWVIIAGLTFLLFAKGEGLVNKVLASAGFERIDVLTNSSVFWLMLTLQSIWKEMGWGTILFLAAIAGVDPQLYEAARMDGASRLRQMWHVTLPAMRTVIVMMLILRLGHIMDVGFEQVFLMYNGAVSQVAEVFDTYVYRVGIQQGQFSYSTASGLFKSVVGLTLVIISNKLAKRFGEEGIY